MQSPLTGVRAQVPIHQPLLLLLDLELAVAAPIPAGGHGEGTDQFRHRAQMLLFSAADTFTAINSTLFMSALTDSHDSET